MDLGLLGGHQADAALGDRARGQATREHRYIAPGGAEIAGQHAADGTGAYDQYLFGHVGQFTVTGGYCSTLMPAARIVFA